MNAHELPNMPSQPTVPCSADEALILASAIQDKLRGEWDGQGGYMDGVNLGLAAMILESWAYDRTHG